VKYLPRAFRYLLPHWPLAVLSVVILVVDALVDLLSPWPLKIVVDNALGNELLPPFLAEPLGALASDRSAILVFAVVGGLLITIVNNGLTVLNSYIQTRIEQKMVLDCRSDLFEHAQRLSLTFHDQNKTGDFMYRINFQAAAVGDIVMTIPPLVQSFITLVGMLWISYQIDAQLTLLAMGVVPFLYYSIGYYANHVHPRVLHSRSLEMQSLSIIQEAMSMMRVIIAFGREGYEHRRFRDQGQTAVDARIKVTVRQTMFTLAVNVITAVGTTLVLGYGAYRVLQGELTLGQLLVVMAYIAAVYQPLQAISGAVAPISEHLVGLRMAFELLDTEPEIRDAPDAIDVGRAEGRVRFEDVHFSYPGRADTLKGISFDVPAGQVVAVVGPTGAGKTTLMSLLPRFYNPKEGRILLDGVDVRKIKVAALREQISVVLQEPLLFSGTIADNIRYGRLDASMEDVMRAAEDANAHEFITSLPDKYDTLLGERGSKLSGGERQRIAVARAFLKDAPILILDEPTSAIDSKTEAVILEALERLMQGRTTFMIAHRLSTVRDADFIVVLQRGELVETGTHDELLERHGLYRQLHDVQTKSAQRRTRAPLTALPGGTERSA